MSAETTVITVPFHVPSLADLLREHDATATFPMDLWLAAAAQHGTEKAAGIWNDAARYLIKRPPVARLAGPLPEDLADLRDAGFYDGIRCHLPGVYHLPAFDGLGEPNAWLCSICWDEGSVCQWPCEALDDLRASCALADHLGLEASS